MSVEINIHTKKCKINKTSEEKQPGYANLSEEKLIEIQAEAYYRAMKRMEEEKEKVVEKRKYTFGERIGYLLNVIFFPWKINKKFKLNRVYDSLLVMIVTLILIGLGTVLWGIGLVAIIYAIYRFVCIEMLISYVMNGTFGLCLILIGSIIILAGTEFSEETDSNKIYAYSASIIAIVSCIVSIFAIFASK